MRLKLKKINKKLIVLILILLITIIVLTIILLKNKKDKLENNYLDIKPSISSEKSEIDMDNLTNSEMAKDGLKVNKSSKIQEGIEFNDLKIKDIKIEAGKNISIFNAKIDNTLDKDLNGYLIDVIFLDESGNEIDRVETTFPEIKKGKTGYITATTTKDIATAYDIKIERK